MSWIEVTSPVRTTTGSLKCKMILNGETGSWSPITSNDSNSGGEESGVNLAISDIVASLPMTSLPAMSVTVSEVRNK